jgi:hypothetical protein
MSFLKLLLNELGDDVIEAGLKKKIILLEHELKDVKNELEAVNTALSALKTIADQAVESAKLIDENRQMIVQLYNVQEIIASAAMARPTTKEKDPFSLPDVKSKDDEKLN